MEDWGLEIEGLEIGGLGDWVCLAQRRRDRERRGFFGGETSSEESHGRFGIGGLKGLSVGLRRGRSFRMETSAAKIPVKQGFKWCVNIFKNFCNTPLT